MLLNTPRLYRGYNKEADSFRKDASQKYEFWFDKPTQIEDLRTASIRAAKELRDSTDKEIVVLYSGGLDSEWIVESFNLAGIDVTPLVIDYGNDLNSHDLSWAANYLNRRGYKTCLWHKIDFKAWYGSNEQKEIAWNCQAPELAYLGQFKSILDHNNGNRIFLNGYDEPVITADDSTSVRTWNLSYNERHAAIHKLFKFYNIPNPPGGWLNSNVFAAYITCPLWQYMSANLYSPLIWNSELMKSSIYCRSFPFLKPRTKYTGFEKMLDVVVPETKKWHDELKERCGNNFSQDWYKPINEVYELLGISK